MIEGGELDITFYLLSPNHEMLVKEERKMDGLHSLDVSEDGDYSLCFDNSFSHISDKTIFMDVLMDSNSGTGSYLVNLANPSCSKISWRIFSDT